MSSSTTPASGLSSNIGGNTFRSRVRSLPLVNELDLKFNQFNITSLQNLTQSESEENTLFSATSANSIPQISLPPLCKSQLSAPSAQGPQTANPAGIAQRRGSQTSQFERNRTPSLPAPQNQSEKSLKSVQASNFKNYDELNLVPLESLDILKLSIDQYGCRYLQKKLEADHTIKDLVFSKIFNNLIELIVDPFGNYLIQKLVDVLSSYQKDLMLEKAHAYLFFIAVNQYGTRSLQKIIDRVDTTYQMDLIVKGLQLKDSSNESEENVVVRLIKDLNGNHVIQKCIFKFPPEKFQFIIDSICLTNNIVRISTHKHGCCVLQKLLNSASFEQIVKISKVLLVYLDRLINDQFGNYIIQFLFELGFLKNTNELDFLVHEFYNKIYSKMVQLSCLKFSSNVIEKFIKALKLKHSFAYLNDIVKLINAHFEMLIKDKFGNYVIQTMIDQFYGVPELNVEVTVLVNAVKNYLPVIKTAPYARKIQLKIQQLEANYTLGVQLNTVPAMGFSGYHDSRVAYMGGDDFTPKEYQEHCQNHGPYGYSNELNGYFPAGTPLYARDTNTESHLYKSRYSDQAFVKAKYNPL